jgi:phosphoribosylaminoimidazole-succinocarboxamide synthase
LVLVPQQPTKGITVISSSAFPHDFLARGKTKELRGSFAIVENKSAITAFDDPAYTKQFPMKAVYATTTTSRNFELLRAAGIPVAYDRQLSPTEYLARICRMLQLEVVIRRYPEGSYPKRFPCIDPLGDSSGRFPRLVVEFFLKTTKGGLVTPDGQVLVEGLDPLRGEEDPLIRDYHAPKWELYSSKLPSWEAGANLGRTVDPKVVLGCATDEDVRFIVTWIEEVARRTFLVLEGALATLRHTLTDLKIEFGSDCVSDVIDNDSWRLKDPDGLELSKEAFRQGLPLAEVERRYALVAQLVSQFGPMIQAMERDDPGNIRRVMEAQYDLEMKLAA